MIELLNVSKVVPSGAEQLTILQSVDLTIADGQFVSITGPSGSGKSTLLGLIAGLDSPSSGDILIDGQSIVKMGEDRLAELRGKKIGFVFQSFHLIPTLTAQENVAVPLELAGDPEAVSKTNALLQAVGLGSRQHHYPAQLSGGEQQRVSVARAFANNPAILLADEPTGNLDTATGKQVIDLLIRLNRDHGSTLVLVTHDPALAAHAERIVCLRDGRIISDELQQRAPGALP